jgi:hypothetical protein
VLHALPPTVNRTCSRAARGTTRRSCCDRSAPDHTLSGCERLSLVVDLAADQAESKNAETDMKADD